MKSLKEWCIENKEYKELELYENANNEKKSDEIGYSSSKGVNWKCNKCGIQWEQAPNKMSKRPKKECPYCMKTKASYFYNLCTEYPMLRNEWDYEKNGDLLPENVINGSDKKVWWKCKRGHEWETRIYLRTGRHKSQCPECRKEGFI